MNGSCAEDDKFQVINICTNDFGGAGKAALRVHQSLLNCSVDSKFFVRQSRSCAPQVFECSNKFGVYSSKLVSVLRRNIQYKKEYCMYSVADESQGDILSEILEKGLSPDVIVLHWISGFVSLDDIVKLYNKFKCKIYWYALDMSPFTGGCHFSWQCIGYENTCSDCPARLHNYTIDNTSQYLRKKKEVIQYCDISAIAANNWLYDQVTRSSLPFGDIHKCYLPFKSDVFYDHKSESDYKNINDSVHILFGSQKIGDPRKGVLYFIEAMKELSGLLNQLDEEVQLPTILLPGNVSGELTEKIPFKVKLIPFANNDVELSRIYNLSELFVSSAIEDSGPMMISESLLCGTPVVSFEMGIAPELIKNGYNGYLALNKDSRELASKILQFLRLNPAERAIMRRNARASVESIMSEGKACHNLLNIIYTH